MEAPLNSSANFSESFPKSVRLLKPKDFRFRPYKRLKLDNFSVIVGPAGSGRLGISLSKKVLRRAVARNRVRRLIREVYRKNRNVFNGLDINVTGNHQLSESWSRLKVEHLVSELGRIPLLAQKLGGKK